MEQANENVEGSDEPGRERWLSLVWASPWVLIFGWFVWHFSGLS
jgi:hypothetical protein